METKPLIPTSNGQIFSHTCQLKTAPIPETQPPQDH